MFAPFAQFMYEICGATTFGLWTLLKIHSFRANPFLSRRLQLFLGAAVALTTLKTEGGDAIRWEKFLIPGCGYISWRFSVQLGFAVNGRLWWTPMAFIFLIFWIPNFSFRLRGGSLKSSEQRGTLIDYFNLRKTFLHFPWELHYDRWVSNAITFTLLIKWAGC